MSFMEVDHAQSRVDVPERRLQPTDIHVLEQIYARKQDHMPKFGIKLLPNINDIINGVVHVREPYTHDRHVPADSGATYYGMLYYRGTIMRNLHHNVPLADWDLQAVIAVLSSNIDMNHSFSAFYPQTCYKLAYSFHKRLLRRLHNLEEDVLLTAYTLACMEYRYDGLDPSRPTYYRHCFAKLYVKNPQGFSRITDFKGKMLQSKVALRVQRCKASPQWASIGSDIKANADFMYSRGDEQISRIVDKKIKRVRGRSKKKQLEDPRPRPVPKNANGRHGTGFACKLPPIVYDNDRIQHHLEGNPLLKALVESTPGLHARTKHENVNGSDDGLDTGLYNTGTLAQALELDNGNPEESDSDNDDKEQIEEGIKDPEIEEDEDFDLFCQNLSVGSMTSQLEAMMLQHDQTMDQPDLTPFKPPEDEDFDGYGSDDMDLSD